MLTSIFLVVVDNTSTLNIIGIRNLLLNVTNQIMINEFGIAVQSTAEPKRRIEFNQWVKKYGVSSMYQKRDMGALDKMNDYNFAKISQKKVGKTFGIAHILFNFVRNTQTNETY